MSMALCDVIRIMDLIQEMKDCHIPATCSKPYVYCKVFKDNVGLLDLARLPKLRLHTKHINVCYHHFCKHVRKWLIKIFPVGTSNLIFDMLTKALPQNNYVCHNVHLCRK